MIKRTVNFILVPRDQGTLMPRDYAVQQARKKNKMAERLQSDLTLLKQVVHPPSAPDDFEALWPKHTPRP